MLHSQQLLNSNKFYKINFIFVENVYLLCYYYNYKKLNNQVQIYLITIILINEKEINKMYKLVFLI